MQYLTIIPLALVGYDMVDKPTRRVNRFLKNAHKLSRIVPDFICKDNRFQLVFHIEQARTVAIFGEHGIMAHIL